MFGIRQKLIVGFGGLLVILLVGGLLSRASLRRYSGTLEKIFRENYDSVLYGQQMREAIEGLDDDAQFTLWGDIGVQRVAATDLAGHFEQNLKSEHSNVTLPSEGDLAAELDRLWYGPRDANGKVTGLGYWDEFQQLGSADKTPAQRRDFYKTTLLPHALHIKDTAQKIIDINVRNMGFTNGQVKQSAAVAERTIYVLIAVGIALGILFVLVISRSILRPLGAVTASAREIEHGNLDLIVPVTSRDELGQLAETFNAMASRLREFRRTDRAKLVRTQRTTQLALGSLPDAVAIVSPEGRIEIANDTARRLFGLEPEAELAAVGAPALAALFRRAMTEGHPIQAKGYEAALQIFNGQERFFLPTAVPILDEERNFVGVTLVLADVTNLRKLDDLKSGMLSVVSHELKTPLTSIRMATHLLLEERVGSLNAKQQELLVAAKEDADRLYEIIENLLDMSRIEAGKALIECETVPAERLVNNAIEEMASAFRDKGVTLTAHVPDDIPAVQADVQRISHVFSNLLGNALKYTPGGGSVTVTAEPAGDVVKFTVADTGPGIADEYLARLFDRFYRVPGQHGRSGAGLGLAIAKDIVEVHGGSIRVSSVVGQGTEFSFTLQRADAGRGQPADTATPALQASHRGHYDR